eukprot:Sspe_Gene.74395::Locus_46092_Transcript_1_1_Confidence_1.000_Length_461::g.74395::m.74395
MSCIIKAVSREGDTPDERRRKGLLVPLCLTMLAVLGIYTAVYTTRFHDGLTNLLLGSIIAMAGMLATLAFMLLTRRAPPFLVGVLAVVLVSAICINDLSGIRSIGTARAWNGCIVIMDFVLL